MEAVQIITITVPELEGLIDKAVVKALNETRGANIPTYLTTEDVAAMLKVTRKTVTEIKHKIGFSQVGKRILFKPENVENYLNKNSH